MGTPAVSVSAYPIVSWTEIMKVKAREVDRVVEMSTLGFAQTESARDGSLHGRRWRICQ